MSDSSSPRSLDLGNLTTLAGAVGGIVAFIYVVGGAVMWLRFWRSGLPADQALAWVPRTDLLVVGMRVMILPALAAGLLFKLLAWRQNGSKPRRRTLALTGTGVVLLVLVVPFSFGAYAWPLAALGLAIVWWKVLPTKPETEPDMPEHPEAERRRRRRLTWWAAAAAVLAAAFVSLARQLDPPVRLPSATLELTGDRTAAGVLVTAGPDAVVVGFPEKGELRSFPIESVESFKIGDPLDRRSPPPSLLARVAGLNAWAATPLELWCGGESYGWTRIADQCQTQPEILPRAGGYARGELRVRVACPEEAHPGCSGFLIVTTVHDFAVDGLAAPLELGRTIFQAQSGRTVETTVRIDDAERACLLTTAQPVALRAVLSTDRAGEGELNGESGQPLQIEFAKRARVSEDPCSSAPAVSGEENREDKECDDDAPLDGAECGDGADGGDTPGGGGDSDGGAGGGDDSGGGAGGGGGGTGSDADGDAENGESGEDGGSGDGAGGDGAEREETLPATPPAPGDEVVISPEAEAAAD
jgi:hypothetical protein